MRSVLVLQHVPYEGQGYIADYLSDRGLDFDVVQLWKPYTLPSDLARYSALVVMGGPMGVYDEFPSKADELALIRAAVRTIPTLGICLGSQLLAHALGASVHPNLIDGKPAKEIGYDTVRLTAEGAAHPLFKGLSMRSAFCSGMATRSICRMAPRCSPRRPCAGIKPLPSGTRADFCSTWSSRPRWSKACSRRTARGPASTSISTRPAWCATRARSCH